MSITWPQYHYNITRYRKPWELRWWRQEKTYRLTYNLYSSPKWQASHQWQQYQAIQISVFKSKIQQSVKMPAFLLLPDWDWDVLMSYDNNILMYSTKYRTIWKCIQTTRYFTDDELTFENVLFPEPFFPMIAWTYKQ